MAELNDMIVQSIILHELSRDKNIKILELGAGSGGWTRVQTELNVKNCEWILVENFNWIDSNFSSENYDWPINKIQLKSFIEKQYSDVKISDIYDNDISMLIKSDSFNEKYKNNISVMRIDCVINFNDVVQLIEKNLTDDAVIIIDDTRVNCGLERIMLVINLIEKGYAYPLCFSQKETIICKTKDKSDYLQNHLETIIETNYKTQPFNGLYYNKEYKEFNGKVWEYMTTSNFEIFVSHVVEN